MEHKKVGYSRRRTNPERWPKQFDQDLFAVLIIQIGIDFQTFGPLPLRFVEPKGGGQREYRQAGAHGFSIKLFRKVA